MFTINEFITYILSLFIPAVKKDIEIQSSIEEISCDENNILTNNL